MDNKILNVLRTSCAKIEKEIRPFRFDSNYSYETYVYMMFLIGNAVSKREDRKEIIEGMFDEISQRFEGAGYADTKERMQLYSKVFSGQQEIAGGYLADCDTSDLGKTERASVVLGDIILNPACVSRYPAGTAEQHNIGDEKALSELFTVKIPSIAAECLRGIRTEGSSSALSKLKQNSEGPNIPTLLTVAGIVVFVISFVTALGPDMMRFTPVIVLLAIAALTAMEFIVFRIRGVRPKEKIPSHKTLSVITLICYALFYLAFILFTLKDAGTYFSSDFKEMCALARELKPVYYILSTLLHFAALAASVLEAYAIVRICRLTSANVFCQTKIRPEEITQRLVTVHSLRIASSVILVANYYVFYGLLGMMTHARYSVITELAGALFMTVCGIVFIILWKRVSEDPDNTAPAEPQDTEKARAGAAFRKLERMNARSRKPDPAEPQENPVRSIPAEPAPVVHTPHIDEYEEEDDIVTTEAPEGKTVEEQIAEEQKKYTALAEELKKFPVEKLKAMHKEGKISDEKYIAAARKYKAIKDEMKKILENVTKLKEQS